MNSFTEQDFQRIPATEISEVAADVCSLVSVLMIICNHETHIAQDRFIHETRGTCYKRYWMAENGKVMQDT